MKYPAVSLLLILISSSFFFTKEGSLEQEFCAASELNRKLDYNDLVSAIPKNLIEAIVERPDSNGALGRNRDGYFHVRFQFEMTRLTDYAVRFESEEAVLEYVKNLNYSFIYQKPEGDFQFKAPNELLSNPEYKPPSEANLVSGTAFFAYSVGMSLNSLQQSTWYSESSSLNELKNEVGALKPNIQKMLDYLKSNTDLLYGVDEHAPNRLLFNAIAFYSLGTLLKDDAAMNLGIDFAQKALAQLDHKDGYFIEGGGWDSSYNGVAAKLAFELFTLLPNDATQNIKDDLEQAVTCATDWQKSRILASGKISTDGNSRVFPGGEGFLGNEKSVDVIKTVKALFYMAVLSDNDDYELFANKVIEYYD